jgi:hypothetical protein
MAADGANGVREGTLSARINCRRGLVESEEHVSRAIDADDNGVERTGKRFDIEEMLEAAHEAYVAIDEHCRDPFRCFDSGELEHDRGAGAHTDQTSTNTRQAPPSTSRRTGAYVPAISR